MRCLLFSRSFLCARLACPSYLATRQSAQRSGISRSGRLPRARLQLSCCTRCLDKEENVSLTKRMMFLLYVATAVHFIAIYLMLLPGYLVVTRIPDLPKLWQVCGFLSYANIVGRCWLEAQPPASLYMRRRVPQ